MKYLPTASEMATALQNTVKKYVDAGIVEADSYGAIGAATTRLRDKKASRQWDFSISKGAPIKFTQCQDKRDNSLFNPLIMAKGIGINDAAAFPYVSWDVSLVLEYQAGDRQIPKWHFDLGSKLQDGPKLHLQYGGHIHDDRALDISIKEPRWTAYPLDIILLMEVVAANFFPKVWRDNLRQDATVRNMIKASETLCYRPLHERMTEYFDKPVLGREATLLHCCWNDTWA